MKTLRIVQVMVAIYVVALISHTVGYHSGFKRITDFVCQELVYAQEESGVGAEIIAQDWDNNGNIRVWTQYKIDGVEVESRYPKINSKFVFCSRYHALNFLGMNDAQKKARILQDVDIHTKSLIQNTCIKKANKTIIFKDVIGSKITNQTTTVTIDGKDYTLNLNGSITLIP